VWFAFQPSFAFRKRTTRGLSKVQKSRKTQRPDSFYPPEYNREETPIYADARGGTGGGVVNQGASTSASASADADVVDVEDNELYVNARHS